MIPMKDPWRSLAAAAVAAGWTISMTKGNHIRWQPPKGTDAKVLFSGLTPSDWRAARNHRSMLRRAGVPV